MTEATAKSVYGKFNAKYEASLTAGAQGVIEDTRVHLATGSDGAERPG